MGSTVRSATKNAEQGPAIVETIRWQSWPLIDWPRWSWLIPAGILSIGGFVWWCGGGWPLAVVITVALAMSMWQFLLPITFEVGAPGVRRYALGRMRLVPWQAVRAYQLRPTGMIFFQRSDPTSVDILKSLFVPYAADADEMIIAIRSYLPHAVELP
jgi:hypothetical protein